MSSKSFGYGSSWANRKQGRRQTRKTIIVVYDGELTEEEYFKGWKRVLGPSSIVLEAIYVMSGGSAVSAVRQAIKKTQYAQADDDIWCVCDVDDTTAAQVADARALAARNGIRLCLSNRSFEIWLGLHYRQSDGVLATEEDAIRHVAAHYPKYTARSKVIPFDLLLPRTGTACANAIWLAGRGCGNPMTDVHTLVSVLFEKYKTLKW